MSVDTCAVAWTGVPDAAACASGARQVTVATPREDLRASSPSFDLAPLVAGAPQYLLITLGVEDSPTAATDESLMGLTGEMAVGLTAVAIDDAAPDIEALPETGSDGSALIAALALAAGLLGLGLALRLRRREAR